MSQYSLNQNLTKQLTEAISARDELDSDEADSVSEAIALLQDALREHASDIHLDPISDGLLVRLRKDGVIQDSVVLPKHVAQRLSNQFKSMARLNPVPTFLPLDGRITITLDKQEVDLRIAVVPCLAGEKISIRVLDLYRVEQEVDQLGLQDHDLANIQNWLDNVHGMLLVTGPTGSGKTTTLYALLHNLKNTGRNILTIEDPVEYQIEGINQIQVDQFHGLNFAEGIQSMLRHDPDYLLLGEIRDASSARAAVNAASSGHVLMATMHSRDAVGAITVLRNYGLDTHEISANLVLVIAQRIVRKLCPDCREQGEPTDESIRWFQSLGLDIPAKVWLPKGCDACSGIGYKGRTGVFEIWQIEKEDYALILSNADERKIHESLSERGHLFLLNDAITKATDGITSFIELRTMGGFGLIRRQ